MEESSATREEATELLVTGCIGVRIRGRKGGREISRDEG